MATEATVPWSDLPKELWAMIGRRLDSHMDVQRFRSVCCTWRCLIPSSLPDSPRLPLSIPYLDRSRGGSTSISIFQSTIYRLEAPGDDPSPSSSSRSRTGWLVKIGQQSSSEEPEPELRLDLNFESEMEIESEERSQVQKMQLLNPLSNRRIKYKPGTFPKLLNMLEFRVTEVFKEYTLRYTGGKRVSGVDKVLISPNSPWTSVEDCTVVGISLGKKLGFWKYGSESWTIIDDDKPSHYDDIILYGGQFYAVDQLGTVSWIDSSMRLVQFSPPMCGGGHRKHLVESGGDLYVVDQYLSGGRVGVARWHTEDVVDFKVYKLDQEWGRWEPVKNLGDALFVLGINSSFSVSVQDFAGCPGNCIYYAEDFGSPGEKVNVFNLADGSIKRMIYVPAYLQIVWPPPTWITPVPCSLDGNSMFLAF